MNFTTQKMFILLIFLIGIFSHILFSQIDTTSVDNDTKEIYKLVIDSKFCDYSFDTIERNYDKQPEKLVICDSSVRTIGLLDDYIDLNDKNNSYNIAFNNGCKKLKINKKSDFFIDFLHKNRNKIALSPSLVLDICKNFIFLSNKDFENLIFDNNSKNKINYFNPDKFFSKYSNSSGYISVSQIGFNKKKDIAILYGDRWCGGKCGEGWWFILKKINNKWKIIKSYELWIS